MILPLNQTEYVCVRAVTIKQTLINVANVLKYASVCDWLTALPSLFIAELDVVCTAYIEFVMM